MSDLATAAVVAVVIAAGVGVEEATVDGAGFTVASRLASMGVVAATEVGAGMTSFCPIRSRSELRLFAAFNLATLT